MARAASEEDQVEGLDEEFLFHLRRGSDQLARGEVDAARGALERALELRSRDAKVLGLLGQACYRQGRYDDAAVAWQRLVDENPAEPAARVNLGLAFLRARRYPQATRQLEIAVDLNPDHRKAMGYLGLALLESGDPGHARDWFLKAGSEQMVARCDEVLAGGAPSQGLAELLPAPEAEAEAAPPAAPVDVEGAPATSPDAGALASTPGPTPAPAPSTEGGALRAVAAPAADPAPVGGGQVAAEDRPALAPAAPAPAPALPMPAPTAAPAAPELAAFATAHRVAASDEVFSVAGQVLAVRVGPPVRVRLSGLLAAQGAVEVAPEVMRFRGRPTEKPFGEGAARLQRAAGEGVLLFAAAGRRFTPVELGAEAAFFREEVLFGFEAAIEYENGRVPSQGAGELRLVHLRGGGAVLLATAGEPVAVDVTPATPLRVPVAALVGWMGELTPRFTAVLAGAPAGDGAIELAGEGRVLVDPAAAVGEAS